MQIYNFIYSQWSYIFNNYFSRSLFFFALIFSNFTLRALEVWSLAPQGQKVRDQESQSSFKVSTPPRVLMQTFMSSTSSGNFTFSLPCSKSQDVLICLSIYILKFQNITVLLNSYFNFNCFNTEYPS